MNHRVALTALGASTFVYVTAEAIPVGLLPEIAGDMSVSEADVGLLVTIYAAVAALTSIPLTAVTMQVPRRRLIAIGMSIFALSQLASAIAPTFALLVVARLVCALAHGIFWATVAPIAFRLVPPGQGGRATAWVFLGNSLAIVVGVPLGTALGQLFGWRIVLTVLAVGGALCVAGILTQLPALPALRSDLATSAWQRQRNAILVLRSGPLVAVAAATIVLMTGLFCAYTFLAPLVRRNAGLEGPALSALLLGFGAAGLVGNWFIGRWVDRRPGPLLSILIVVMIAALALLVPTLGPVPTIVAVLAWGAAMTASPVIMQAAVLRVAPQSADAASAVYVVAFQVGIGGGSFLGERIVRAGYLEVLPIVGLGLAAAAFVIVVASRRAFPSRLATVPALEAPKSDTVVASPAGFSWFQNPNHLVVSSHYATPAEYHDFRPVEYKDVTEPWWYPQQSPR
ncbi:MFS transporter [Cryptosporangium sp. NPDC048952]|uniref:MFS transporter n=1 Tax=Cryptosporangium sp. NPDC048952 TaxID=3363961 RepID=UPI0037112F96